jgi:diphosphomevalonate decarboxylase
MTQATARAHANIALVKYWGKRDPALNLPAAGSLSLTLDALTTTTAVQFDDQLGQDELILDGAPSSAHRLTPWLDLVRQRAGIRTRARVTSANDFPTASGLASSASGYAALAVAATAAAGLEMSAAELSALARRGSGSAARSIFGGFVEMGTEWARAIDDARDWDLRMVVAVVDGGAKKKTPSRDGMEHCARTSPLYAAWLETVPGDLAAARRAIAERDLAGLGQVAQHSAMAMHAAAMASRPSLVYFQPATLAALAAVQSLPDAYYTIDAGPHVKVLTRAGSAEQIADALRAVAGVSYVVISGIGGPAARISAG